tara:strand:- start:1727 stop:3007 length:1281 start_codon:yes stop_codon:yes gene_type:complete
MRQWYSALLYILLPVVLLRLALRSVREPAYRYRLGERFGFIPAQPASTQGVIWIHAVSVGEVHAVTPVVWQLLGEYPRRRVMITTTTPAGSARVREIFGSKVAHAYLPFDLPGAVQRFLRRLQPALLILVETELWPNLLHYSKASGCKLILANARLSARSARRYGRVATLTGSMLTKLDRVACQSRVDGERFLALGLPPSALVISGSLKFDTFVDDALRAERDSLRAALNLGDRPVVLAASTHPGEEEPVLEAYRLVRRTLPHAILLFAPRHLRRCSDVRSRCAALGLGVCRRSESRPLGAHDHLLLVDTLGELRLLSGLATVAFIGGSLVEHGGQNPLEAVAWGVPVICGPHTRNFTEVNTQLAQAGALITVNSSVQLGAAVVQLLQEPARRAVMAQAGQRVLAAQRGAGEAVCTIVREVLREEA